jgi:hypothetical protein
MCVSNRNNYKCQKRDQGICQTLERWNEKVFDRKGARVIPGKLGAWLVLEIDQGHFLENM